MTERSLADSGSISGRRSSFLSLSKRNSTTSQNKDSHVPSPRKSSQIFQNLGKFLQKSRDDTKTKTSHLLRKSVTFVTSLSKTDENENPENSQEFTLPEDGQLLGKSEQGGNQKVQGRNRLTSKELANLLEPPSSEHSDGESRL